MVPRVDPVDPNAASKPNAVTTANSEGAAALAKAVIADAAIGKTVTTSCPPNAKYPAKGAVSLVDGQMGSELYDDEQWMGWWYEDKPFVATIDLGATIAIRELGVHTMASTESWIFFPRQVEFEVSNDDKTYKKIATVKPTAEELESQEPAAKILKASNLAAQARYVRVRAQRYGKLPEWHVGHGGADGYDGEAWLFIDEILVNPK